MIIGIHEILGLEELVLLNKERQHTVKCYSQKASAYFISREDFIRLLKTFNFDESVLHELALKRSINRQRLTQLKKGYLKLDNLSGDYGGGHKAKEDHGYLDSKGVLDEILRQKFGAEASDQCLDVNDPLLLGNKQSATMRSPLATERQARSSNGRQEKVMEKQITGKNLSPAISSRRSEGRGRSPSPESLKAKDRPSEGLSTSMTNYKTNGREELASPHQKQTTSPARGGNIAKRDQAKLRNKQK